MNAATMMWKMGFAFGWVALAGDIERSGELVHWSQAVALAVGLDLEVIHG